MAHRLVAAGLVLGIVLSTVTGASAAAIRTSSPDHTTSTYMLDHESRAVTVVHDPPAARFCAAESDVAAEYVVPPLPFKARMISVRQMPLPATSDVKHAYPHRPVRLYRVVFRALVGNAVLPSGHTYAQFAYVTQLMPAGRWCFVAGGSGP